MAGELLTHYDSGATLYAIVIDEAGRAWNTVGSALESVATANWADYELPLVEQDSSGLYLGDFPSGILAGGQYRTVVYEQSGGSPAATDPAVAAGSVHWDGTTEVGRHELSQFDAATESVTAATVTGDVQGGVIGAVGSVTAGVLVASIASDAINATSLSTDAGQELADALLGRAGAIEGLYTPRQVASVILAAVSGVTAGFNGAQPVSGATFKAPDALTNRITADTDAAGNRTATTLSPE